MLLLAVHYPQQLVHSTVPTACALCCGWYALYPAAGLHGESAGSLGSGGLAVHMGEPLIITCM